MLRWILRVVWLALSAMVAIWVCEGLFGVDQSESLLPFLSDRETGIIVVGVFWGISTIGMSLADAFPPRSRARRSSRTRIAIGEIIETRRTGLTVNDVPQYDVYLQVSPADGASFVSVHRGLLDAMSAVAAQPGSVLPVRYDPAHTDAVDIADSEAPEVRTAILDWRIAKGLIRPDLVGARTRGIAHPANVLRVRPTGTQREGNVELDLALLVTPDNGQAQREVETTVFLRPEALDHVQVGSPVFAMWEPGRPDKVAMTIMREEPTR